MDSFNLPRRLRISRPLDQLSLDFADFHFEAGPTLSLVAGRALLLAPTDGRRGSQTRCSLHTLVFNSSQKGAGKDTWGVD